MGTRARGIAGAALALLLAGCSQSPLGPAPTTSAPSSPSSSSPSASTFDPAATTKLYLPGTGSSEPLPLLVLVPGGGWQSHDSSGFFFLAQALADDDGVLVATTEYRAGNEGIGFPDSLQDVLCSAAYAVAQAKLSGYVPSSVTLVGHSAGGHLAALAGVSGTTLAGPCLDPIPVIEGVVGLAGVYDTARFQPLMTSWFGVPLEDDPELWASGDPIHYVETGAAPSSLHVLLIHGDDDEVVPVAQAEAFDRALTKAGIPVTLDVLPGERHMSVIAPDVVQKPIEAWLESWAV